MPSTVATVQATIEASIEDAFAHIVPINLTSIFTGYGPLLAVTETRTANGGSSACQAEMRQLFTGATKS
jgi:hypothetical protein